MASCDQQSKGTLRIGDCTWSICNHRTAWRYFYLAVLAANFLDIVALDPKEFRAPLPRVGADEILRAPNGILFDSADGCDLVQGTNIDLRTLFFGTLLTDAVIAHVVSLPQRCDNPTYEMG